MKENTVSKLLLKLEINLKSINSSSYMLRSSTRLSKAMGVSHSSSSENVTFWKFNQIDYEESRNGGKTIIFSRQPSTEIDFEDIIADLFDILGADSIGRQKMLQYELMIYRNDANPKIPVREWNDFDDYDVELCGYSSSQSIMLFLSNKKKSR
jgi:hypothetical protein